MADLSIQNAFLEGIEEIFSIMFTEKADFSLLDVSSTETNIYNESKDKVYLPSIPLVAKIVTTFSKGELPVEGVAIDAVISVPTKQLIDNNIPHDTEEDLEVLKQSKFYYRGFTYLVSVVKPKTLVADMWQVFDFMCYVDKTSSLSGESS